MRLAGLAGPLRDQLLGGGLIHHRRFPQVDSCIRGRSETNALSNRRQADEQTGSRGGTERDSEMCTHICRKPGHRVLAVAEPIHSTKHLAYHVETFPIKLT
jgi:hypothetical protein